MKRILIAATLVLTAFSASAVEFVTEKTNISRTYYLACEHELDQLAGKYIVFSTSSRGVMVYKAQELFCPHAVIFDSYFITATPDKTKMKIGFIFGGKRQLVYDLESIGNNGYSITTFNGLDTKFHQTESIIEFHNSTIRIHDELAEAVNDEAAM